MAAQPEFQQRLEAIEELIGRIENSADPAVKASSRRLVELVMELHGTGLERMLEMLHSGGEPGQYWIDKFGNDDRVAGLLILHGVHPLPVEERVEKAIEKIRPSLKKRGGEVEILSVESGIVKLRLRAAGHVASGLKEMIESAVYQAAPDLSSLSIEAPDERVGFVPIEMLRSAASPPVLHPSSPGEGVHSRPLKVAL